MSNIYPVLKYKKYYFIRENKILPAKSSRLLNHLSPETKERNNHMSQISIYPQQVTFCNPTLESNGKIIIPGIELTISFDAMNMNKEQIKKSLTAILTEALEYFD